MTMPPSGMLIIQLIIHNRLPLYLCTNHTNQAATTLAVTLSSQKDCMSKQGRGGFKDIICNVSDRLLLYVFFCLFVSVVYSYVSNSVQTHRYPWFQSGLWCISFSHLSLIFRGNSQETRPTEIKLSHVEWIFIGSGCCFNKGNSNFHDLTLNRDIIETKSLVWIVMTEFVFLFISVKWNMGCWLVKVWWGQKMLRETVNKPITLARLF